jgi:hypothetical protein
MHLQAAKIMELEGQLREMQICASLLSDLKKQNKTLKNEVISFDVGSALFYLLLVSYRSQMVSQ